MTGAAGYSAAINLWESDSTIFLRGLQSAKELAATDPDSAKLKIDSLKPFISSYTGVFRQLAASPEKTKAAPKRRSGPED